MGRFWVGRGSDEEISPRMAIRGLLAKGETDKGWGIG